VRATRELQDLLAGAGTTRIGVETLEPDPRVGCVLVTNDG
jgi:hypothetical protein